jgi:secreted Zn-dependent insulinase-like peptidase
LQVAEELKTVTFGELQEWARALWREGFGEVLVQGNFEEAEALQLVDKVAS